jgi:hypothetical protein
LFARCALVRNHPGHSDRSLGSRPTGARTTRGIGHTDAIRNTYALCNCHGIRNRYGCGHRYRIRNCHRDGVCIRYAAT